MRRSRLLLRQESRGILNQDILPFGESQGICPASMDRYPDKIDLRHLLDRLYARYNRREFVHPDPLEFLYHYSRPLDQEIVGLLASCLAYGRVNQILKNVSLLLGLMGSPSEFVLSASREKMMRILSGFRYRFNTGREVAFLLMGVRDCIEQHGSMGGLFARLFEPKDQTLIPALTGFVKQVGRYLPDRCFLLPDPERGSPCKRSMLFLRWMVRKDLVDPGIWEGVPQSKLVVPLDTHMFQAVRLLGFTNRKRADLRAAVEATEAFARLCPEDPVKYDFVLTRFGIRPDMDLGQFRQELCL